MDWVVVEAVRCEPVSLVFAQNRVIFEKNSERITKSAKNSRSAALSRFFDYFENREKQGGPGGRNRVMRLSLQGRKNESLEFVLNLTRLPDPCDCKGFALGSAITIPRGMNARGQRTRVWSGGR